MRSWFSVVLRITLVTLTYGAEQVQADLIFSAPPRENAEQGQKLYEPFARYLSEIIGDRVVYEQPRNWVEYSVDMRRGRYDIVFDGPHFTAWRMKHLNHAPIARLPGATEFMLVSRKDDPRLRATKDLVHMPICTLVSPNLGTAAILSQFKNPVLQPEIYEVKGGFEDVYKTFTERRCRAAVVRDFIYRKLSQEERNELYLIYKTPSMPNQTISVGERVHRVARAKLTAALTVKQGLHAAESLFSEFSKKARYFVKVNAAEYDGLETYLEGVVWGW